MIASQKNKKFTKLSFLNNRLFQSISKFIRKDIIVDSSKEITRGFFLLKYTDSTKIIHLIKNQESILSSNFYRIKNGEGFKFLRKKIYKQKFITRFFIH